MSYGNDLYSAELEMYRIVEKYLQEAEQDRLGRMVGSAKPGLLDRALAGMGSLLIFTGKKLQRRHAPARAHLTSSPTLASR